MKPKPQPNERKIAWSIIYNGKFKDAGFPEYPGLYWAVLRPIGPGRIPGPVVLRRHGVVYVLASSNSVRPDQFLWLGPCEMSRDQHLDYLTALSEEFGGYDSDE